MTIYEFKREDAERFAMERGKVKFSGKELQMFDCPYCHGAARGDKYTFAINLATGAFNCKRASCGAKGNMITLSRDFDFSLGNEADSYYRPEARRYATLPQRKPEAGQSAVEYLSRRGIPEEIVREYNIASSKDNDRVICFPFYDENDCLQFIKYRNLDFEPGKGSKEWCQANCKPILFGMNHCDPAKGPLIMTEGQIDSLSVAAAGIPNAVSVPNGKNGFSWIPHCWEFLQAFPSIIIFGDCERGEITLLDEMSRRFGSSKAIWHVREEDYKGHKDANELLRAEGAAAIRDAINQAELVPDPKIIRVADIQRVDMKQIGGVETGFGQIDKLIEKMYFGQLILLTGERGHGKSTLAMQFGARAVDAGVNTFFYSGELVDWMFKAWMERQMAGRRHINTIVSRDGERVFASVDGAILPRLEQWYQDKLYLYNNALVEYEGGSLLNTIEMAIIRNGCKFLVIDNLMTAMNDDLGADLNRQQTRFVKELARIAKEHGVIILLIAHPKKIGKEQSFDNDDVSGSSNITNLCDIVMRYARPKDMRDTNERLLCITKNRLTGRTNYEGVPLWFEETTKRISAIEGLFDWSYGWEGPGEVFENPEDLDEIPF